MKWLYSITVFEMNKYQEMGVRTKFPVIIPNAKITNAIIPNVTYNGGPN